MVSMATASRLVGFLRCAGSLLLPQTPKVGRMRVEFLFFIFLRSSLTQQTDLLFAMPCAMQSLQVTPLAVCHAAERIDC